MSTNLSDHARACIENAIYGVTEYDHDALAEAARENVTDEVDTACIYTHDCQDIINRYESEYGRDAEDLSGGKEFKAEDWRDAMVAYAANIAYVGIGAEVERLLTEIEEKAEALTDASGND